VRPGVSTGRKRGS